MSASAVPGPAARRSLLPIYLLVAVFAAPAIAAWFYYLNPEYLPAARSNRGELLEPIVPVSGLGLAGVDGGGFDLEALAGRWTLVAVTRYPCGQECRARAEGLGRVWAALGESRVSVERLLLIAMAEGGVPAEGGVAPDLPGVRVAVSGPEASRRLALELGEANLENVYILDPLGRLMMRYAPDAPLADVLKDTERLLKASKNWIKGAQYGHR